MLKRNPVTPDKAQDGQENYVKNALYVILITALTASGTIAIISTVGLIAGVHVTVSTIVVTAIIAAISLALLWLTWQDRLTLPRLFFPLVGFSAATFLIVENYGVRDEGMLIYPLTVILAGLLLGKVGIVIYAVLSLVAVTAVGYGEISGLIVTRFSAGTTYITVVIFDILLAFMGVLLYTTIDNLTSSLGRARRNEHELAESNRELQIIRTSLEQRVEERTQELSRRSHYLEATAVVAREASTRLELQELLSHIAVAVNQQFGFYHTGIFMLNPSGEWAVLTASSSAQLMQALPEGLRLRVGEQGIVGFVAGRGTPHIVADVQTDATYFGVSALPDTRSEMALPLRARGTIIGVLDVQSDRPQAFGSEEAAVLQILADQVALAISNAKLFEQAQASLEAERRLYGEVSAEAWRKLLSTQTSPSFRRSKQGLDPAGDIWRPEMKAAVQTGKTTVDREQPTTLATPIKVRDQVVGVIDVRKRDGTGDWTPEQTVVVETLAEQLAVALESARLYQDTQRRAAQERLIGQVTTRIRETLDTDTILQTAISEIAEAMGIPKLQVRLATSTAAINSHADEQ